MIVAKPQGTDVLADRALNGIEEVIYYHGEEIGRRRRYDSRLLLAHLARLDKAEETNELLEIAHDFDAALERLRRGEPVDPDLIDRAYGDDEDEERETVTYGEAWEDESLPFVERVLLYQEWLEAQDEGDNDDEADDDEHGDDEEANQEDEDDEDEDDGEGHDVPEPPKVSEAEEAEAAAEESNVQPAAKENPLQDSVTPVTPSPSDTGPEAPDTAAVAAPSAEPPPAAAPEARRPRCLTPLNDGRFTPFYGRGH